MKNLILAIIITVVTLAIIFGAIFALISFPLYFIYAIFAFSFIFVVSRVLGELNYLESLKHIYIDHAATTKYKDDLYYKRDGTTEITNKEKIS